jgi:hypothetical protein
MGSEVQTRPLPDGDGSRGTCEDELLALDANVTNWEKNT